MAKYKNEKDGQEMFYATFLPRVAPGLDIEDIIQDSNDGVLNGNLLEFKLNIANLDKALSQAIRYLSQLRIKGKPVPANILLIDLNAEKAWVYLSAPHLAEIEKVYEGGASSGIAGFVAPPCEKTYDYSKDTDTEELIALLKTDGYTKINIDGNCVAGWAFSYYAAVPMSRKEDFIGDETGLRRQLGEIRQPRAFSKYINPYEQPSNAEFGDIMDKLNDFLQKKDLGAFYTPPLYVEKATELLRKAIARVPEGNDYIILDRCCGTGNLLGYMTNDELSHCIVSTVEYFEYKVLEELYGAKVRHIIPPVEKPSTFNAGLVQGADALQQEYVENEIIQQYLRNEKCSVILFENPPYAETTSVEHQKKKTGKTSSEGWKTSFVVKEMKKHIRGTASNDLGNAFIWSGFHYYLRQPTDSYVLFSPVKYWKAQHLVKKQFVDGIAVNRRHFHTNINACIMVALWANIDDTETNELLLTGYDVETDMVKELPCKLSVKRIASTFSATYYDKREIPPENRKGILVSLDGTERANGRNTNRASGENILGYMAADSSGFDNPDLCSSLLIAAKYNGNGFFLWHDNFLEKLPMFAASRYITYNREWTERGRIMKSADGADKYNKDVQSGKLDQFLLKCLLFTCLETQNHMRSFTGSDGRQYRNELCLDTTNGPTLASKELTAIDKGPKETALIKQWNNILTLAKITAKYDKECTYGLYQIIDELDTSHKVDSKTVYDYVELHSAIGALKGMVASYYNSEIVPTLFEYEYLK